MRPLIEPAGGGAPADLTLRQIEVPRDMLFQENERGGARAS
jgi:hypothetical protein